jgi:hypothetical protein
MKGAENRFDSGFQMSAPSLLRFSSAPKGLRLKAGDKVALI